MSTAQTNLYSIVSGNNRFALEFFSACAAGKKENVFLSPFSITSALAMTYEGARDTTALQMLDALHFVESRETLREELSSITRTLNRKDGPLVITNTLWAHQGSTYQPDFLEVNRVHYDAGFKLVDFDEPESARQKINAQVQQQTKDKIKDLLPARSIDDRTRLVITNAIYFKDEWNVKFKKELTRQENFFITKDKPVKTWFMHHSGNFNYYENEKVSILEMPYLKKQYSMLILLPRTTVEDLEKALTIENYSLWLEGFENGHFKTISIPRFKIEQATDVVPILKNFGMTDAFLEDKANFKGISEQIDLFITGIFHKAFVEVNEEGTEAAAATAVVVGTREMAAPSELEFIANRPFVFIIRDNMTGSILFIGKLMQP